MRLLVTGASGFLGRNALLRAPRDWEIVAVYHEAADFPAWVAREGLAHVRVVRCDLSNVSDVQALRGAAGPVDAALYLAANGDPAASARDPIRDLRMNAQAALTFLEHCPVPHLVYLSSGAVYDGLAGVVTPASSIRPRLPYAISKLAAEQYVQYYSERRGSPESYVNVRFFGAYGPYEPVRKITTKFLTFLKGARSGDERFVLRGDGRNLIDFMFVDDAIDGLFRLLAAPPSTRLTVDFASGHPTSVADIVRAMSEVAGRRTVIAFEGATEEYIEFRSGDRTMAERFGFTPRVGFDEGCRRLSAFLAEHADAAVRG
ncbi:MAG: NAD-dependent epimerase/dehydratase family protein [Vicinamibacterales bacterium]